MEKCISKFKENANMDRDCQKMPKIKPSMPTNNLKVNLWIEVVKKLKGALVDKMERMNGTLEGDADD